jgi:hypothetical protein
MLFKQTSKTGLALKVVIVFLATGYITWRLSGRQIRNFSFEELFHFLSGTKTVLIFSFVILLMPLNWLLESLKWKIIASTKIKIPFRDAVRGVLAGVTIGTATPNRVGEFAGRIFMVEEGNRVELLLLSFIAGFCQVFITVVAGIAGIILNNGLPQVMNYSTPFFLIGAGIIFCAIPFFIKFLPASWKKRIEVIRNFPRKKLLLVFFLSALRYTVYVSQFVILLNLILPGIDLAMAFRCVTITYFIVTIVPTFSFTEVFVRGSAAIMVFYNPKELAIGDVAVTVAVLLWTINVAVPSLIGSVFVFRLKFSRKEK